MCMCASCIVLLAPSSPVTDVPHGEPSMAPWLWACSIMQDCLPLRAKSTVILKLPRCWLPWDTVVKESDSADLCSSAGSKNTSYRICFKLHFSAQGFQCPVSICGSSICVRTRWSQLSRVFWLLKDLGEQPRQYTEKISPTLDMKAMASSEARISSSWSAPSLPVLVEVSSSCCASIVNAVRCYAALCMSATGCMRLARARIGKERKRPNQRANTWLLKKRSRLDFNWGFSAMERPCVYLPVNVWSC